MIRLTISTGSIIYPQMVVVYSIGWIPHQRLGPGWGRGRRWRWHPHRLLVEFHGLLLHGDQLPGTIGIMGDSWWMAIWWDGISFTNNKKLGCVRKWCMYWKLVIYRTVSDLSWKESDTVNHRNSLDLWGCYNAISSDRPIGKNWQAQADAWK